MIDKVLVLSLDRWGTSVPDLAWTLLLLDEAGIGFLSLAENVDILVKTGWRTTELLEVVATFESALQRERVREGLEFARCQGMAKLDRPRTAQRLAGKIQPLHGQKLSKTEIANRAGIHRRSVGRVLATLTAQTILKKNS